MNREYTSERLGRLLGFTPKWIEENIDEKMIPILTELNRKGYYTQYCCSGHPEYYKNCKDRNVRFTCYIVIYDTDSKPFDIEPPQYEKKTSGSMFSKWKKKHSKRDYTQHILYYYTSSSVKYDKKVKELEEMYNALLKWTQDLKSYIENEEDIYRPIERLKGTREEVKNDPVRFHHQIKQLP